MNWEGLPRACSEKRKAKMIFLLILCFLLGILFRRTAIFPSQTPLFCNRFVIYISLPSLILLHLREVPLERSLFLLSLMPWLYFLLGALFFYGIGKWRKWSRETIGCLMLVGGLGNTSFIGFPMIEAFFGHKGLPIGMIVDQAGSFTILTVVGMLLPLLYSRNRSRFSFLPSLKKTIFFPPFIATILALVLIPFSYPEWLRSALTRLADTLIPLALFSVGFQLHLQNSHSKIEPLAIGLCSKLILFPFFFFLFYRHGLGQEGLAFQVTIFEAAMPPMITAGILASEENLDPDLATLMVGIGISLSFITLPIWFWFLK